MQRIHRMNSVRLLPFCATLEVLIYLLPLYERWKHAQLAGARQARSEPKNQMALAHERTLAASPGLAANERALAATTGLDAAAFHAGASSALRDAQATLFATEAQHLTLVSAPSDDDAPARRAKKRAAAATPKKAKARKILVEC